MRKGYKILNTADMSNAFENEIFSTLEEAKKWLEILVKCDKENIGRGELEEKQEYAIQDIETSNFIYL